MSRNHDDGRAPRGVAVLLLLVVLSAGCTSESLHDARAETVEQSPVTVAAPRGPRPSPPRAPADASTAVAPANRVDAVTPSSGAPPPPPLEVADGLQVSPAVLAGIEAVYHEASTLTARAYASGRLPDPRRLRRLHGERLAAAHEQRLAHLAARGLVERASGTEARWAELAQLDAGRALVRECRLVGEGAGHYERETGRLVEAAMAGPLVVDRELVIAVDDAGAERWVVETAHRGSSPRCGDER